MTFRLTDADIEILTTIAEHRVLSTAQLATLLGRNAHALRRRLVILKDETLIRMDARGPGAHRGRPENLLTLSDDGVDLLKARGVLDASVPYDHATARKVQCLDHELLVNDFRVQLIEMGRFVPALAVQFLASTSPRLPRSKDGRPLAHERITASEGAAGEVEFTLDGVLALTHRELGKTLLFFLEVDMGTQPLASPGRTGRDVRQKLSNYRLYFQRACYRRYEEAFNRPLRGFRLLLLTESPARLAALCRLVRDTRPSDFVWLTSRASLMSRGVWAAIWARGGRDQDPLQSILGTQVPNPCPIPVARP